MAICTLRIGDRVVLASEGGAPEVEYLLFDPSEVEFRSTGAFGKAQEVAYQTTVKEAAARLAAAGFSWPVLLQCVSAMQPTLSLAYARGPAVRRVATALGAAELFEASHYDAATKVYVGRWLDLDALGVDAAIPGLMQALQGLYLLALLREVSADDPVRLVTRELMARGRAGSRSYRRWSPPSLVGLPKAIRDFAETVRDSGARLTDGDGMSSAELREQVSDRVVFAEDLEAKDRLRALVRAIEIRDRPAEPPLDDPELWAIDEQLSCGRTDGVPELVDSIEESKGKDPATDYLRVRAAFLTGREAPRAVAERAASLAMSSPSFAQLQLLASEAWIAAGDPDRALLFAGDLLGETGVDPDLPVPESRQLEGERASIVPSRAPPPRTSVPPVSPSTRSARPPPSPLRTPPSGTPAPEAPRDRRDRTSDAPTLFVTSPVAEGSHDVPSPLGDSSPRRPTMGVLPPALEPPPEAPTRRATNLEAIGQMRGASQPPSRHDSVALHVHVPRVGGVPGARVDAGHGAEAAMLPLPDGLRGAPSPIEVLPKSVLDARVQFTFLSRELGIEYEKRLDVTLRADVSGLEAMQRVLLERYGGRAVATTVEAADVLRHGAFLSEVLARSLGAFWVDIAPADIGYWAMVVPPASRVWPFGWVLRVIVNADPEENLAGYFRELAALASPPG